LSELQLLQVNDIHVQRPQQNSSSSTTPQAEALTCMEMQLVLQL